MEVVNGVESDDMKEHCSTTSPQEITGTVLGPIVVEFSPGDIRNPMNFPTPKKWLITSIVTMSVFAVTLTSSAYSGSAEQIIEEFHTSSEVFALGFLSMCWDSQSGQLYGLHCPSYMAGEFYLSSLIRL